MQTLAGEFVCNVGEAFRVHPIGKAIAQVFDNAETVMHDGRADLQATRAQQKELGSIFPGADAAHPRYRQSGALHRSVPPSAESMLSAIGFTAGPAYPP